MISDFKKKPTSDDVGFLFAGMLIGVIGFLLAWSAIGLKAAIAISLMFFGHGLAQEIRNDLKFK